MIPKFAPGLAAKFWRTSESGHYRTSNSYVSVIVVPYQADEAATVIQTVRKKLML